MTGICSLLWHYRTGRIRELELSLPYAAVRLPRHRAIEEFSYFTLLRKSTASAPASSLFGISCTRHINAKNLKNKSPDVTRSTVQKAVVVVTDEPHHFGKLRERLSVVTKAWFAQECVVSREYEDKG